MNFGHDAAASGLPEDRPVPAPEDLIGSAMNFDGVEYRLDGIEAIGSKFVVFRARNVATNTVDKVAKVPREQFNPCQPLLEAMPVALEELAKNPGRAIRICERLLALDPAMEAAAFNLGTARYAKQDITGAMEAFARALSLAPDDVLNLLHRASCLAVLTRDEECLHDFITATEVSGDAVRQVLTHVRPHALNIQAALGRLSKRGPAGSPAMQALDNYF